MRILQVSVSNSLRTFSGPFMAKYGLVKYTNNELPAVFFGCYPLRRRGTTRKGADIQRILGHKALDILVWGGTDATFMDHSCYRDVLRSPYLRHVAISKFISEDLLQQDVPHIYLPIFPSQPTLFKPTSLGNSVYVYLSRAHPEMYGKRVLQKVMKLLPKVKFIQMYNGSKKRSEMAEIYKKCFMGLRLTQHDGLSNTVVELGLMGRKCVWNGWLANAISWRGTKGVVRAIQKELDQISGATPRKLARQVKKDLVLPCDWLDTAFWERK